MRRAIALSHEMMEAGAGGPFGAVIAYSGEIVAEGWNLVTSSNDPTAHAEMVAIRRACEALGRFDLRGLDIYTSCEPCPMCLAAIYWARLDRIWFGNDRQAAASIGFDELVPVRRGGAAARPARDPDRAAAARRGARGVRGMGEQARPGGVLMPPRLALVGITKRYASTLANDAIDLQVRAGEIHALLGENGAGKSTLVKIIYGVVQPDSGSLSWEGAPVAITSPNVARALGIGMVFQHFSLFESLTVAENIALGLATRESLRELSARIADTARQYGLAIEPGRHVHHLSVGERQRVEILRCLLQQPKLLIMDEPTSVLTPQEVGDLFAVLRRLAAEGCSILYISHKLDEIIALCECATVLRAGRVSGTADPRASSPTALARLMTGSDVPACRRNASVASAATRGAECLVLGGLTLAADEPFGTTLHDLRLVVRAGEICGVAGVAGNGQKELLAALSGERRSVLAQAVYIAGHAAGHATPAARRRMGLAFVPEERLGRGAVAEMSLAENALLTTWQSPEFSVHGWLRFRAVLALAGRIIERFRVAAGGVAVVGASLSGGNMQKFIIGREMAQTPRLLVAAHPTWGVDIGATLTIHQALIDLAEAGAGVLVVSEDLAELFEVCDRIAVLSRGRLSAPVAVGDTDVNAVGLLMGGHAPPTPDVLERVAA